MIKTILAVVVAIAIYMVLGQMVPFTHMTLFTIPALGSFGAFSLRLVLGCFAGYAVYKH